VATLQRLDTKRKVTAGTLQGAECIFFSRPDGEPTTDRSWAVLLMAVNRRLLKERLNLNPGLKQKTKRAKQSHLKLF
jgi:hypothetical protein